MTSPSYSEIQIPAKDGFLLSASLWKQTNPKGVIALNAGTCIKRNFYQTFCNWLALQNYDVINYDYRGVGGSSPMNLEGFKASIVDWGRNDIAGVIDWVVTQYPNQKRYMIGHSMGGQVLGLADNINQLDKIVTLAASYGNWKNYTIPRRYKTGFFWATLIPLTTIKHGYFPAQKYNMGENWPKGVAWNWWAWCLRRIPHSTILDNKEIPHFYKQTKVPISAYFFTDDELATKRTIPHYQHDFANAPLEIKRLHPEMIGVKKIGHMGVFKKKCHKIWEQILEDLQRG
jgi:predicted alpha/beta hydrolase